MLEPGDKVDRYVVEGELGEGSLATVYRVRHTTLSTVHALKVIKVSHRESRDRLIREGQVQAQLSHQNIVAVTDVLQIQGSPGTLMEWVQGVDLEDYLQAHHISLDEALTLFRGIACGMGHAHAKGLVHRDLKPANVLLAVGDGRVVPKVSDFGLVKALSGDTPMGSTRTGMTMGTPGYMAPEQVRDAATVDRRADMWSLGCLLYRMVCNYPAFPQADIIELFTAVGKGDYPPPTVYVPDLPARVVNAIEGLLQADPADRIHSCDELVAYLDAQAGLPEGIGAHSLPPCKTPVTDLPCWLKEDGEVGTAATKMMASTEERLSPQVTGAAAQTWDNQPRRETIAPPLEEDEEPPSRWPVAVGLITLLLVGAAASAGIFAVGMGAAWTTAAVKDTPLPEPEPVVEASPAPSPAPSEVPPSPDSQIPAPTPPPAPQGSVPAPVPAPAPAPAPAPVSPRPAPAPEAAPAVDGPTARVDCAECEGVTSHWVADAFGNRMPNGQLTPGSYVVWIKVEGDPKSYQTTSLTLTSEAEQVRLRCNASLRNCSRL